MGKWIAAVFVAGVAVGLVALFYQFSALASRGGTTAPLYSTERYDPYGAAALFDLLAERGVPVRSLRRSRLDEDEAGVLVQVLTIREPSGCWGAGGSPEPRLRSPEVAEWIAKGNALVLLARTRTDLMRSLDLDAGSSLEDRKRAWALEEAKIRGERPGDLPGRMLHADWTQEALDSLFSGADPPAGLRLRAPVALEGEGSGWRPLAAVGEKVVAAEARHGEGRIVLVGAPTPALNHALGEGGNLDFLLAVLGEGPVLFDDWSHGLGHSGTIVGLLHAYGLLPVLFQVVFVLALYVWSQRGRSCPGTGQPARPRSSVEQVKSLARLYAQTLTDRDVCRLGREEVVRRLARALRCPPSSMRAEAARLDPDAARKALEALDEVEIRAPAAKGHAAVRHVVRGLALSNQLLEEKV